MVCIHGHSSSVMTTRKVVSKCSQCQTRMQAVADLLLLTSDVRPVLTEHQSVFSVSFTNCKETIIAKTKGLSVLVNDMNMHLHSVTARWEDVISIVHNICEHVVSLTENCAHAAYLIAISKKHCAPAVPGIVNRYELSCANLNLEICCTRLKTSTREELTPPVLVEICSDISQSLSVLTECCRKASECSEDVFNKDQFKLCIKSLTSCASCLMASIKRFKTEPNDVHHRRCAGFCEPLVAASRALIVFATEEIFLGNPALLSQEAKEANQVILGACMSIVSASIQICKTIKELVYNNTNTYHRAKLPVCAEAISKSSVQLVDALKSHVDDRTFGSHGSRR